MITSETLLCDHLVRHNISVNLASMCLVLVRTNGLVGTFQGQSDLVYPPRGRPLGCRGLQFVDGESDMLNACNGRSWSPPSQLDRKCSSGARERYESSSANSTCSTTTER